MKISTFSFRRWAMITFALCCLIVNIVAFVLYQKNQKLIDSNQWVLHTYHVITTSNRLFAAIQNRETAERGFLLTGSDKFLDIYSASNETTIKEFKQLKALTKDNLARQEDLKILEKTLNEQAKWLDKQIYYRQKHGVIRPEDIDKNKEYMDYIRLFNAKISSEEQKLFEERHAAEVRTQQNYVTTIFSTAGISVAGLLIANGMILFLSFRRQNAEQSLRRINKEMEGFTYIASHDLRSPLVNLKGFATEMRYALETLTPIVEKSLEHVSEDDRKKAKEALETDLPDALGYIHSSVEKMDKLTNAILDLSRLGHRQLSLELVNVEKIVRHCLDTLQHQISSKNIKVTLHNLPNVTADPLSIEQVFGNIIDNAVKYLDPKRPGEIEFGGIRTYRQTKYWVKDNGRGINTYDQEKIFEIYRRAGNNVDIPGEGMGMAYVRTTLRRMGGMIWCESTLDKGSTFYFTISNNLKEETYS